jgi:hypothetical protein
MVKCVRESGSKWTDDATKESVRAMKGKNLSIRLLGERFYVPFLAFSGDFEVFKKMNA